MPHDMPQLPLARLDGGGEPLPPPPFDPAVEAELSEVPIGSGDALEPAWPFNEDAPVRMSKRRIRKMVRSPLKDVLTRVLRAMHFRAGPPRIRERRPMPEA